MSPKSSSTKVKVTSPQLSSAVGGTNSGIILQFTSTVPGTLVKIGASSSVKVKVAEAVVTFPQSSVAV